MRSYSVSTMATALGVGTEFALRLAFVTGLGIAVLALASAGEGSTRHRSPLPCWRRFSARRSCGSTTTRSCSSRSRSCDLGSRPCGWFPCSSTGHTSSHGLGCSRASSSPAGARAVARTTFRSSRGSSVTLRQVCGRLSAMRRSLLRSFSSSRLHLGVRIAPDTNLCRAPSRANRSTSPRAGARRRSRCRACTARIGNAGLRDGPCTVARRAG